MALAAMARVGRPVARTSAQERRSQPRPGRSPTPAWSGLGHRRLVVVTGKGGVGKTAVAAALGSALAAAGRRVLVLEVEPRENAHQMLGLPPSGGEIVEAAAENLHLQNLKPRQVLDEIVRDRVKVGMVARRVLASPIYHQLAEGMPGLKEVAMIHHALASTAEGGGFDVVVLDAPATGHGVTLLAAPLLISEVIDSGPVGQLAGELAAFVADPERCGVVVVTLAEEMPVQEALELAAMLRERIGREPELLVVNGLYPPVADGAGEAGREAGAGADAAAAGGGTGGRGGPDPSANDDAERLWQLRRRVNERQLARLDRDWPGRRLELPLLPVDRGPDLVAALAARLAAGGVA